MSHDDIIRAWKDEAYRQSLSEAERALLPEHPAGLIELTDPELEAVAGANAPGNMLPTEDGFDPVSICFNPPTFGQFGAANVGQFCNVPTVLGAANAGDACG